MKELSIQEKARAYDEALKVLHKYDGANIMFSQSLKEEMFPELKKSENDDIRETLYEYFKRRKNNGDIDETWYGLSYDKILSWLEQQDYQKPILDNTLKEAFDKSKKDYSLEEKQEASDYSESIIPTSIVYGESEEEYMLHSIIEAAFITGQNIKLKSIFSEEDEKIYNRIYDLIHNAAAQNYDVDEDGNELGEYAKIVGWFKAFKYRVQPKQEWSEEDKGNLLDVKCIIDEVWHNQDVREEIDHSCEELESLWHWLNNLWERVEYPQNTWKPNTEQMEILYKYAEQNSYDGSVLTSLYNNLKKLME